MIKFISRSVLFRMTLLLGPPGAGKTTLLKALAGELEKDLRVRSPYLYDYIVHVLDKIEWYNGHDYNFFSFLNV